MALSRGGAIAARRPLSVCAAVAVVAIATAPAAGSLIIDPGLYRIFNHDDGGEAPPYYGLRLDELFGVSDDHDVFTFSFDEADGAEMFLRLREISESVFKIRIFGQAFGGLIDNGDYVNAWSGLAKIDFTYMVVLKPDQDDDYIVTTGSFTNSGSITFLGMTIDLFDRTNAEGFTFRLGDEDSDNGHRGFGGISGWGWLDHYEPGHPSKVSDWLFTLDETVVPEPGTTTLIALAAALVLRSGPRRRSRAGSSRAA